MATTKKAAAPAAKAAPAKAAAKAAPAKAAPAKTPVAKAAAAVAAPAAKAAPKARAPKAAPIPTEVAPGVIVEFAGYPDGTEPEDMVLVQGQRYEVTAIEEPAEGGTEETIVVRFDNPDFNPELAEDADTNPSQIETGIFLNELAISADQTPMDAEAAPVESAPPVKVKAGKKAAAPAPVVEAAPEPEQLELEQEDADVLAMIEGAADVDGGIIGIAQDLENDIESKNFQLGGVLFHIHKDKSYEALDARYKEAKGFEAFVNDYFKFSYRKAMNLIDIYYAFNLMGIENAAQIVAELGWTKASKLAPAFDDANVDELIELARNNTVEGLSEAIKVQQVSVGGVKGEQKTRVTIKVRFFEDVGTDIMNTLERVKEEQGLKSIDEAFSYIVDTFNQASGEEAPVTEAPKQAAAVAKGRAAPAAKAAPAAAAKPTARRAQAAAA